MLSPVGLALRNLHLRHLLDANLACLELIGYSLEEARRLPFEDFCPPDLQPKNVSLRSLQEHDQRRDPPSEANHIHERDFKVPVQLHGAAVKLDEQKGEQSASGR